MFPRRLEITASAGHERRYTFFQDGQVVPRHSRRNAEELASARSVLAGLSVFGNGLRSRQHREVVEDSGGQLQPLAQRSGQGLPFWRVLFGCGFPQKPPPPPRHDCLWIPCCWSAGSILDSQGPFWALGLATDFFSCSTSASCRRQIDFTACTLRGQTPCSHSQLFFYQLY